MTALSMLSGMEKELDREARAFILYLLH